LSRLTPWFRIKYFNHAILIMLYWLHIIN
jgi:hypothetical protein